MIAVVEGAAAVVVVAVDRAAEVAVGRPIAIHAGSVGRWTWSFVFFPMSTNIAVAAAAVDRRWLNGRRRRSVAAVAATKNTPRKRPIEPTVFYRGSALDYYVLSADYCNCCAVVGSVRLVFVLLVRVLQPSALLFYSIYNLSLSLSLS